MELKKPVKKWYQFESRRIDKFLNSWISKKLSVFIIATAFLFIGKILPQNWVDIAMIYIFTQGAIDLASKIISKNG
jgi:hypothetical protein